MIFCSDCCMSSWSIEHSANDEVEVGTGQRFYSTEADISYCLLSIIFSRILSITSYDISYRILYNTFESMYLVAARKGGRYPKRITS